MLKLAPESVLDVPVTEKEPPPAKSPDRGWLKSGFKLSIDGLPCDRVFSIDALGFQIAPTVPGDVTRHMTAQPRVIDAPNLRVTFHEGDAAPWRVWFKQFVIDRNNQGRGEKNGKLHLLSPAGAALSTIDLSNLGIFKLVPTAVDSDTQSVATLTAEMYCEQMEFDFNG
jgi:hypothetical protein